MNNLKELLKIIFVLSGVMFGILVAQNVIIPILERF